MEYFVWALMLIGWVYLLTEAAVFAPFRIVFASIGSVVEALIYCPTCTGFWVGIILALCGWWPRDAGLWALGESGIAAMAVVTTWSKLTGGNNAWYVERGGHDSTKSSEEREGN